jgi:hypothetical protein
VDEPKGIEEAEIARDFFGVQLHYAGVLSRKAGMPLDEAITFHTNFHRLFAYGNLSKQPADPDFAALARHVAALPDNAARIDALIRAYADRPADPWPKDRFPFGNHFACEAPNADGDVRIHFRNRFNKDEHGPLHASNFDTRRADLTAMFRYVAREWPDTRAILGQSWLYNTSGYRRLFPAAYTDSCKPLEGPRTFHGLSTWGQFVDFRGRAKPDVVEAFKHNLEALDIAQPWLSFPYQVLAVTAPFEAFREEYDI